MKKSIIIIVLATLWLNFSSHAQSSPPKVSLLKPGQSVPEVTLSGLTNYTDKNGSPESSAKLSDFKGELIILDFWASWCSPCLASLPKLDKLQSAYKGKVRIIALNYETAAKASPIFSQLFSKSKSSLLEVYGEKTLHALFPHVYLPHYVWIDGNGLYQTQSGSEAVTDENIQKALKGDFSGIAIKNDRPDQPTFSPADPSDPALNPTLLYASRLERFGSGPLGESHIFRPDSILGRRITLSNLPLNHFYPIAYKNEGEFRGSAMVIQLRDSNVFFHTDKSTDYLTWLKDDHGFSYSIRTPYQSNIFAVMQTDLANYFPQYKASVEKVMRKAYVLTRMDSSINLATKGGKVSTEFSALGCTLKNVPIAALTNQLREIYMQKSIYPFVDESGIKERIDLQLDAKLNDMDSVNKALSAYGLKYIIAPRLVKTLFIRDAETTQAKTQIQRP